jgi:hypothetical protein
MSGVSLAVAVEVEAPAARAELCRDVLASLPDWFGIPAAVDDYVRAVADLPTFAVGRDGFVALKLMARRRRRST